VYWGMSLRGPDVKLDGLARAAERRRVLRDAREYPSARDSRFGGPPASYRIQSTHWMSNGGEGTGTLAPDSLMAVTTERT
jgi:hypothetical protein